MPEVSAVRGVNVLQLPLFRSARRRTAPTGVDVHAISRPARTFTGDFFFTHRHGNRLWFALGDVAGKGLNAAVFMAMIQEELEHRITSCAATECDPAATMERLHVFLRPLMPSNKFATVVIGHLRDDGLLTIANAGHPPPLVVRANGTIDEVASTGPAAGILASSRWTSTSTNIGRSETVLLYSDGIIESETDGEELGVAGLRAIASASVAPRSASATADAIVAKLGTVSDDLTLMVLRRE